MLLPSGFPSSKDSKARGAMEGLWVMKLKWMYNQAVNEIVALWGEETINMRWNINDPKRNTKHWPIVHLVSYCSCWRWDFTKNSFFYPRGHFIMSLVHPNPLPTSALNLNHFNAIVKTLLLLAHQRHSYRKWKKNPLICSFIEICDDSSQM